MKSKLSQKQRIVVAAIYLVILVAIFNLIGGNFRSLVWDSSLDSSIWFYAGAFLIILGSYIVEPYFTKPSDAIVNSFAVILALLGLSSKNELAGYTFIFWYATIILLLSIVTIFIKDSPGNLSKITFWTVETFGRSKVIFSIIYLSATYSYFANSDKIIAFISVIAFWICIVFFDVVGIIVSKITRLINYFNKKVISNELGQAIGCENPLIYKVEIDYLKHNTQPVKYGDIVAIETNPDVGSIGIVINTKQLLTKQWLSIFLLRNEEEILKISLNRFKLLSGAKSIFTEENLAYLLDIKGLDDDIKRIIEENDLYKHREQFIGYVTSGSNINSINFAILKNMEESAQKISEGSILKTNIYGNETLYQVINGNTKEEHLENFDKHGYIIGIARKLGQYDQSKKELNVCKWVPSMYSPLFFAFSNSISQERLAEIAKNSIGRLPETDLEIPIKDINSIVTHNTAILGILGIGKSCLAYELIKKVADNGIKVICIDITNEYYSDKGLLPYLSQDSIVNELGDAVRGDLKKTKDKSGNKDNPNEWGNENDYVAKLDDAIKAFIESDKKVLILNPDWHPVAKAMSKFNIQSTVDLTVAEKTRIISERLFVYAMKAGQSDTAKYLLVYEEAHSLVPEWNSVVNEGDKNATNGTAKVILQGRKYGLGCLAITQRTANVSKSILNQCNTMFALRVFDDTGKGFLENYVGQDYSNTLPTLEEQHVIAIGKGLKLKQPVILQLNHKDFLTQKDS